MKKFSLIAAMALCVTIGGVYATWNYAQGSVETAQDFIRPTMTEAITDGTKGKIAINFNGITAKIDDANNDHQAELTWIVPDGGKNYIEVTFTPSVGVDEAVSNNGIKMSYTISVTDNWTYEDKQILTVETGTVQGQEISYTAGSGVTGPTKSFKIYVSDLKDLIKLGTFSLPTHQDYLDFQTALNRGNIRFAVSEVV